MQSSAAGLVKAQENCPVILLCIFSPKNILQQFMFKQVKLFFEHQSLSSS